MTEVKVRKSGYDTGAASEFLVLSNLYRLGINAFISLGNKKSIDIIVKAKNGLSLINYHNYFSGKRRRRNACLACCKKPI